MRNEKNSGFILVVVLTLVMIVGIMAGVFLSTARQSMRTVRQWETYDNALWAAQSAIDAQRHKLDSYFDTVATGRVVNLANLTTLTAAITNGTFNLSTGALKTRVANATDFPYRVAVVHVEVTCTNSVDATNEYLIVSMDGSATYRGLTRRFRENVRFQTDRSIFRYAYFEDDATLFFNAKNLIINGDVWSSDGMRFLQPTEDLVINGDLYSAGLITVGTQYVHTAYQPKFFAPADYVNERTNSGLSTTWSNMCSFIRPYVLPASNGVYAMSYRTNSLSFSYKDRYIMPRIDISWWKTNATGVLTNGGFPCRLRNGVAEKFNGVKQAPFSSLPGSSTNPATFGYVKYSDDAPAAGYKGDWNPYRYWLDEVLVKKVQGFYGGSGTWTLYRPMEPTFSSTVTNAKGPESIYLQIKSGIYTNLQDAGCLHITGSVSNPFSIHGNIVVEGDVYIEGYYTGQGSIYAGRNIYILDDLLALNPPVWSYSASGIAYSTFTNQMANNLTKDFLGLFAAGNLLVVDDADASGGDGEFGARVLIAAPTNAPYRTTATNLFNVTRLDGEPWFMGNYLETRGTRVNSANFPTLYAPITEAEYADPATRTSKVWEVKAWMTNGYQPMINASLTNGEPRTYLAPCISSNAYFAYTRKMSASSTNAAWKWNWDRQDLYQIDAVLYTEHFMGGDFAGTRINGGIYLRRSGFKEMDATPKNYWDAGLFGYEGNVQYSFNWDCRLGDPAFNQYLPLYGFKSVISSWVEMMPAP